MIKTLAMVTAAALAALLLYAAARPDTFRVQRSVSVNAPPAKIHLLINDMRRFNSWNPYAKKDPDMKGTYRGPEAGPGAAFDFAGKKSGTGRIEVVGPASATGVSMRLDMTEPFEGHNRVEFLLVPEGGTTRVTWAMHGPSPYLSKLVGVFLDMDTMIGRDFEAGLADMKALAEQP